ncbi:MAG: glycosyltransferase family 2 protein [Planctomycetaceae bacterium]|jgi:glycosyltransferase involved in cell wall biosynthesis|nr:glycosyltransferase family 2 protein [Phycisphaerales bacterium]MCE2653075.1 glycosyltransferase family 2 protein [Planctomycetaceae bacterium]
MTASPQHPPLALAAVAIGRNEGERLHRCLRSLLAQGLTVIYVDSGSTDNSVAFARSLDVHVVELDRSKPFSAARARNEGYRRLRELAVPSDAVQFIDGDCELAPGWIDAARHALLQDPRRALVSGRRKERFPDVSVYNRLCDLDWAIPFGPASETGGDLVIRASAFEQLGGYDPLLLAGEDPDLCRRAIDLGHTIYRPAHDMTVHDAAITSFRQFWRRSVRTGWAYAALAHKHAAASRYKWREVLRAAAWGAGWPALVIAATVLALFQPELWPLPAAAALLPLVPITRSYLHRRRRNDPAAFAAAYAIIISAMKPAEAIGLLQWCRDRLRRRHRLIEYK